MGNICRSPTAEEVLRVKARAVGLEMHFDSAGTEGYHVGDPPDPRSVRHAGLRGYDLSRLRARRVTTDDFTEFDLILAADHVNLRALRTRGPSEHLHKLALLLGRGVTVLVRWVGHGQRVGSSRYFQKPPSCSMRDSSSPKGRWERKAKSAKVWQWRT
ncbi:MAG: low molecular weight protein-tyrosine-phosphatase [Verrucomicrobiota bacterium]